MIYSFNTICLYKSFKKHLKKRDSLRISAIRRLVNRTDPRTASFMRPQTEPIRRSTNQIEPRTAIFRKS